MKRTSFATAIFAVGLAASPSIAQAPFNRSLLRAVDDPIEWAGGPLATAAERARASVVHVFVEVQAKTKFRIERPGSGVVVAPGLVVTCSNLVAEAIKAPDKRLFVTTSLAAASPLPATVIATDEKLGVALLEVVTGEDAAALVPLRMASAPRFGEDALVFGFGDGEEFTGLAGVLSASGVDVRVGDRGYAADTIFLTDGAIQRRSHGAALLDREGALLGVCVADAAREFSAEPTIEELRSPGFGFAVRASAWIAAFPRLREVGEVRAPLIREELRAASAAVVTVMSADAAALASDDPYGRRRRAHAGSGVVVDASGLVLTNRHLVAGVAAVRVLDADGVAHPAEIVHDDQASNTAVLRISTKGRAWPAIAAAARTSVLAPGDRVFAIGRPGPSGPLFSAGVLSAIRGRHVQFDASAGNENGGGALVNAQGELIAILDGGAVDRIEVAFAMRGDRTKLETGLNRALGIERVLQIHESSLRSVIDALGRGKGSRSEGVGEVVERVGIAMLDVYAEVTTAVADVEDNPFATAEPKSSLTGQGSGVVIDGSGLAITNWHVVDDATAPDGSTLPDHAIRVRRRDGRIFRTRVLSISREEDLALLQLELEPGEAIPSVAIGSSAVLRPGDRTIAIGNPHGQANTVTVGVVTAKNQSIKVRGRWAKLPHLLGTDAAINPGNSGGALLDERGRLIGINSAGGSLHAVTGYAIAVDHVLAKLHSVLLSPEKLRSAYAGIAVIDTPTGVEVAMIDASGPAAQVDLAKGDRVIDVRGRTLRASVDWALALTSEPQTEPLSIQLERGGSRRSVQWTPWSALQWSLVRQSGALLREIDHADAGERITRAVRAFVRASRGDPNAEPSEIPESLLEVVARIDSRSVDTPVLQAGDLILAARRVEATPAGDITHLELITSSAVLNRYIHDHASYEGTDLEFWIARGDEVVLLAVPVRRLIL
ncbi:MAG: trypsin-like peptidase domain-containing protein [Planctomycetota bacterium]